MWAKQAANLSLIGARRLGEQIIGGTAVDLQNAFKARQRGAKPTELYTH